MTENHVPFEEDTFADGSFDSADQGGTYHNGALFALDLSNSTDEEFDLVVKLQVKATPEGSTYADYTATPTLFTVDETDAGDVKTFVVAPSASADLDAYMPRYWRLNADVTSAAAANEVQTIDLGDIGAADTYKLTFNAHETVLITFSADMHVAIQAALIGLVDFVTGDLVVTKGAGQTYAVTFGGAYANQDVSAITITTVTGFTPTGVVETTPGHAEPTFAVSAQMLNG